MPASSIHIFLLKFFFLIFPFLSILQAQDFSEEIATIKSQVSSLMNAGEFDAGMQLLKDELPKFESIPLDQAELFHQLALKYYNASIYDSAWLYMPKAVQLRINSKIEGKNLGRSWLLRAAILREQNDHTLAERSLKEAMRVVKKIEDEDRLNNTYAELARLYKIVGNLDLAHYYADQSILYYKTDDDFEVDEMNMHILKGSIYDDQEHYNKAIASYENGLSLLEKYEEKYKGAYYNNFGVSLSRQNKGDKAIIYFEKAAQAFKESYLEWNDLEDQIQIANVRSNLAEVYNIQNKANQALSEATKGIALLQSILKTPYHTILAELYQQQGMAFAALGEQDKSLKAFDAAIQSLIPTENLNLDQIKLAESPILNRLNLLSVLIDKAAALRGFGLEQEAIELFILADQLIDQIRLSYLTQSDRVTITQRTKDFYNQAVETSFQLCAKDANYCEQAYYFIAKNKAHFLLEDMQSKNASTYAQLPDDLLFQEGQLRDRVLKCELQLAEDNSQQKEWSVALANAKKDYFEFLGSLQETYPAYYELKFSVEKPLSIVAVRNKLESNILLLDYYIGTSSIFLFAINKKGFQIYQKDISSDFTTLCRTFRDVLEQQNLGMIYLEPAHKLYQILLKEVLEEHASLNRLQIIPDGPLNLFAFESLLREQQDNWEGKNNSFLIKDYAISYLYSNQFLEAKTVKSKASKSYAGFGLEYDDFTLEGLKKYTANAPTELLTMRSIGRLSFSDDEIQEAAELWQGKAWVNETATKDAFWNYASDANIIHLAMHGLLDEQHPLNSALIFTRTDRSNNNFLRAGELYGQSLSAELAVLSACQTAYEGAQLNAYGLKSLARAFTYAGCESLVASQWNATDKNTKEIILSFYQGLKEGLPKDIALQKAKLQFLNDSPPAFSHAFFWSPLVMIGTVEPLASSSRNWYWLLGGVGIVFILIFLIRTRKK